MGDGGKGGGVLCELGLCFRFVPGKSTLLYVVLNPNGAGRDVTVLRHHLCNLINVRLVQNPRVLREAGQLGHEAGEVNEFLRGGRTLEGEERRHELNIDAPLFQLLQCPVPHHDIGGEFGGGSEGPMTNGHPNARGSVGNTDGSLAGLFGAAGLGVWVQHEVRHERPCNLSLVLTRNPVSGGVVGARAEEGEWVSVGLLRDNAALNPCSRHHRVMFDNQGRVQVLTHCIQGEATGFVHPRGGRSGEVAASVAVLEVPHHFQAGGNVGHEVVAPGSYDLIIGAPYDCKGGVVRSVSVAGGDDVGKLNWVKLGSVNGDPKLPLNFKGGENEIPSCCKDVPITVNIARELAEGNCLEREAAEDVAWIVVIEGRAGFDIETSVSNQEEVADELAHLRVEVGLGVLDKEFLCGLVQRILDVGAFLTAGPEPKPITGGREDVSDHKVGEGIRGGHGGGVETPTNAVAVR